MNIKRLAVYILITSVSLLALLAVLSIWNVLDKDIFWKSISTIGVIAFASMIVIMASSVLESKNDVSDTFSQKKKAELKKVAHEALEDIAGN